MVAHRETLTPAPDIRIRPRRRNPSFAGPILATVVAIASVGGAIGLASKVGGTQPTETGMPTQPALVEHPTPLPLATEEEKAINKVAISPVTKEFGAMAIVPFGGKKTPENPYGYSFSFNAMTIVDIRQADGDKMWYVVTTGGDKLEKEKGKKSDKNLDGTTREEDFYKGFTAWILVDHDIVVNQQGSNVAYQGLGMLKANTEIGQIITFNTSPNQNGNQEYEQMNLGALNLLDKSIGNDTTDRSVQKFTFKADFATLIPQS